ncbi:hypothetical protein NDU88_006074 [Pleurodeles waltl]|uniref:Lung adenoma susceptibility protein 2 n=1 Tax=Pleurodeles waltl TaxID=8319 RepID=A0AAV7W9R5_PLEWA|nr:hypothetical protein NDU88_006074 [Pleurodeles waltl]
MASFIGEGDIHTAPSSISISSLLASCSLGSSSTYSRSLRRSVQYKDKLYDSASKALEAYIQDFEESLRSPEASIGQICIHTISDRSNTKSGPPTQQKAISREWMGKPSSFSSVSRRRVTSDPELASLTTDDLLGFASDGSLPVDQTYTPKLNRKQNNGKGRPPSKKLIKSSQRSSSLDRDTKVNCYNVNIAEEKKLKCRAAKKKHMLEIENATLNHRLNSDTSSSEDWKHELVPTFSSKDYPRWLTSQKSDLNVSGITSISDIKYPVWLKNYDLLSDSGSDHFFQTDKTTEKRLYPRHKQSFDERFLGQYESFSNIPQNSNNNYSESDEKELFAVEQHARPFDPQRLCFKGSSLSRHSKEPFKDDQIELLLLKAERTLESSNRGSSAPTHKDRSPQTQDILEADRSWEKIPVTFKSPVPVFCEEDEDIQEAKRLNPVNEFHKGGLKNECQEQESTLSGGNHHGPVEALKQMLFNLQTVQQNLARDQSAEEKIEIKKISAEATSEFQLLDQEMMPVNNSLQKALHHLSRLKELVEESNVKQAQECLNPEEGN